MSSEFKYSLSELSQRLVASELIGVSGETVVDRVGFDSRQVFAAETTLFVALRTAHRDGHRYLQHAFRKGVRHFLLSDATALPEGAQGLLVPDTRLALQELARQHRLQFTYPVIGITGSNGKTIVKEWLATLCSGPFHLVKSPKSYNSQIGVPLSVLGMKGDHDLGIFEAGISQKGEMEVLESILQPDLGIMTHFGDAHAEGFATEEEKLAEKLKLFRHVKRVLVYSGNEKACQGIKTAGLPVKTVGFDEDDDLQVLGAIRNGKSWDLSFGHGEETERVVLPIGGKAALENGLLVVLAARELGLDWDQVRSGMAALHPVSMRMEMITDNPALTVINDAYNADQASVLNAFSLLENEEFHPSRGVVLTDLEHQGARQEAVQQQLLTEALRRFGSGNVWLVGPVFHRLAAGQDGVAAYPDTESLLSDFDYARFRDKTILLKGARRFELERLIPYLSRRAVATWFKVNMNDLAHNFRQFKAQVPAGTRFMAMVKAFAYGSGSWEIAQALEQEGIDYLAVAYTSAGINLRTHGIQVPIVVMNADVEGLEQLIRFGLEPAVYNLDFLRAYVATGRQMGRDQLPVHLKVDTGMRRLGFTEADLPALQAYLQATPEVKVHSIFSHLASADEPQLEAFTRKQIADFAAFADALEVRGERPLRHILNTAGILRFPEAAMDMVRLGIGLYGVPPVEAEGLDLREVGSLHSVITQIHRYPAGTPIGYGCSEATKEEALVATVPVGYADGIRRSLSNGVGRFLVRGQRAPVLGRVCMDMLMLDVTHISGVREGDPVVLIGAQGNDFISVRDLAAWCGTISYEILTGISQRVRRVYVRE